MKNLNQYFTPQWAAELIIRNYYPELNAQHFVIEPSCGDGRFLNALPEYVPAIGIEIDPFFAMAARQNTGRNILTADFTTAEITQNPTHIIGNPPFQASIVDKFLDRSFELLKEGGQIGFILPVYLFQTASRVMKYSNSFTLRHDLIPRNIFHGLEKPLMFAQFIKEPKTRMLGMFLYAQTDAIDSLKTEYKKLFRGNTTSKSLWKEAIEKALMALGGEAELAAIYKEIETKRPTETKFWREQIRKVCNQHFTKITKGVYALAA